MVRINKVCLKEGYLDEITAKFKKENRKHLILKGSSFIVNLAIFCFWVYQIVTSNFQEMAICMALITGFIAGRDWNRLWPFLRNQFSGISDAVKSAYDSDLTLLESGKNCALMWYGLIDFGNRFKSENVVQHELNGYPCYCFNLFGLDLDDLPEQSESLLTINLVLEESDADIPILKAVIVDEEDS